MGETSHPSPHVQPFEAYLPQRLHHAVVVRRIVADDRQNTVFDLPIAKSLREEFGEVGPGMFPVCPIETFRRSNV